MNKIKRILIIDDDAKLKDGIIASFNEESIEIDFCLTQSDAVCKIDSCQYYDLIILDWFLEEGSDTSMPSQYILTHLYNKRFIPVFIWTKQIDDFNSVRDEGKIIYPGVLINGISKDEINVEQLKERISQWLDKSLTAQVSRVYRDCITYNLEKTFFDLSEIPNEDLASILKVLIGSDENIDWSTDFVLNLIHRQLLSDANFIENLKTIMTAAVNKIGSEELAKRRKIINKVLYFHPTPNIIRCGDIIEIKREGATLKYGIIVTPDCDIEQKNTRYIEVVELKKIDDSELNLNTDQKERIKKFNHDSFYYFPSILIDGNLNNDFVAILKAKFILEPLYEFNKEKYPGVPEKLNYSCRYLFKGKEVELNHLCSKSNPYKSDFLQKLYANNSRVGTPDIKDLLRS